MQINIIILLSLFSLLIFSCTNSEENSYYRTGIVLVDTLKLTNGLFLVKGNYVQISLEKSTEEGTFILLENDSDLVYSKYIGTLCWLKNDLEIKSVNSNEEYKLMKNNWLIFESVEENYYIVKQEENVFKINKDDIYFDNKEFYEKLFK